MNKKVTSNPSVQQFKQFVKKHPHIIQEVREGHKTWQAFYEEWSILGEEDLFWKKYQNDNNHLDEQVSIKEEEAKESTQLSDILTMVKSINLNELQGHIKNLSSMMNTLQGLLQTFQSSSPNQGGQSQQNQQGQPGQQSPFNFRRF